ncbi:MAG: type I 3-dehydroquinate dehydratase [Thermodesulfobacteriota bacterium]|nr:type I 3-dehydroquinate dehydratase [Thermodesulfobacteriota bacterium]
MICVAVSAPTMSGMLAAIKKGQKVADAIELRLDGLKNPELASLIKAARPRKVVVTNRSSREGGLFAGKEAERIRFLAEAVALGADYVDLEWRTAAPIRERLLANKRKTKVIFSYHDFAHTPSRRSLLNVLKSMRAAGADVGKIVTMATSPDDNITLLSLLGWARQQKFPLIAFCMGEMGKISRLATLPLGGYMTYASPGRGRETAPGQISASTLRQIMEQMGLS